MNTKIEKKRISILGCGWLGYPLSQRLLVDDISNALKGSTTSESKMQFLEAHGVDPYLISLSEETVPANLSSFLEADLLIIAIPPRTAQVGSASYPRQIKMLSEAIQASPIQEIIFVSSTGVYPDLNRTVYESDVTTLEASAAPHMFEAEQSIEALRSTQRRVCILRYGGLLGYNRIPGKYVQGQKNLTTGDIPVNYIHRDDAVGIIALIAKRGVPDETFNIVAPVHRTRRETYLTSCAQFNWEVPTFSASETAPAFKKISAEKFQKFYPYRFAYPDPIAFFYSLES
jgi:nucleoside-diphosphate-sugar epimerase